MNALSVDVSGAYLAASGALVPIGVLFEWCPRDPWVVEARFPTGVRDVVWLFGRDLLFDGLTGTGPVGDGDVRVVSIEAGELVELDLSTPDGCAVIELDADALFEFLTATYEAIPAGEELLWAPMDDELTELLIEGNLW